VKKLLHVGCGRSDGITPPKGFTRPEWQEIRLDINPDTLPDIIGNMTDMKIVEAESIDAIYSSHNIEHLYPHEVPTALAEFLRVLKPDGFLIITCPDLQSVCEAVVQDKLLDPLYVLPSGPIAPLDILYGHRGVIAAGNTFMAHKSGFTMSALMDCLKEANFLSVCGGRRLTHYDIWLAGSKCERSKGDLQAIVECHFP
jgi:SAM-dependent methyltransferase